MKKKRKKKVAKPRWFFITRFPFSFLFSPPFLNRTRRRYAKVKNLPIREPVSTRRKLMRPKMNVRICCSMTRANSMLYFAFSLQLREPVAPRRWLFLFQPPSSAFACPCLDFVTRVSLSRRIRSRCFRSVYVRIGFESCARSCTAIHKLDAFVKFR